MIKSICVFILISYTLAQDMQVRYVSAYTIDVKWGGEVETIFEVNAAPDYLRINGKLNFKRWLFRMFSGERGIIKISGTDNLMNYNAKRERYWLSPPEDSNNLIKNLMADGTFFNSDQKKENTEEKTREKSTSESDKQNEFMDIFDNDNGTPKIDRNMSDGIEDVNGFRTKKWITTISTEENKMVIEEWIVDQLPLKDSLYSYIFPILEIDTSSIDSLTIPKFSSYDIIKDVDSTYKTQPMDAIIVLAKLSIDSDNGWVKSMEFEIRELYTIPFDASSFAIPEEYERFEIEEELDEDGQDNGID